AVRSWSRTPRRRRRRRARPRPRSRRRPRRAGGARTRDARPSLASSDSAVAASRESSSLSTLHERALRSLVAAPRAVKRSDRAGGRGLGGRYAAGRTRRDLAVLAAHDGARQEWNEQEDQRGRSGVEPDELVKDPAAAVEEPRADHVRSAEREVAGAHHQGEPETLAARRSRSHRQ